MDEIERVALEREVQEHMGRAEALLAAIRELEENLEQVVDPPQELTHQLSSLKRELRGRMAAIAMGEARLGVDSF